MATRRERVVLELEDQFTAGTIRAAAASELLDKRLNSLSKSSVQTSRAQADMERSIGSAGNTAGGSSREIDRYSGRLGLLVDVAATLGPSLVPIGAVGIPALTGLANAAGMAALAGGAVIFAFQGVGDALKAVDKARLEPTTANLTAAHLAMQKLGPDARALVGQLSDLSGTIKDLRNAAASGVLPGVSDAIDSLLSRIPEVEKILHRVGTSAGDLFAAGADSLASSKWDDFFTFLKTEAPPAITELGKSVGNLAHAAAALWMAFGPLNASGLDWLVKATAEIDKWATGLSKTQGFADFVAYIKDNGPQVGDTLAAIAMALLNIVEAAAPIGSVSLPILEAVAKVISAIADSDLGTPLLGFLALSRAVSLFDRGIQSGPMKSIRTLTTDMKSMAVANRIGWRDSEQGAARYAAAVERSRATLGKMARSGAIIGGLALAQSGLTDKVGLSNTAMFASLGLMEGPWGAAVGGAIGLVADLAHSHKTAAVDVADLTATYDAQTGAITENTRAKAVAKAQDQGLLDLANRLGISGGLVIDSILGNADAQSKLNGILGQYGPVSKDAYLNTKYLQQYYSDAEIKSMRLNAAARDLGTGVGLLGGFFFTAQGDAQQFSDAMAGQKGAADDTKGALADLTTVTDINKDGVIDNTDAILANIQARNDQTDAMLASFDAMTAYQRALDAGSDREKQAADLRAQIAAAEVQGNQDRAGLRSQLASAKTPAERKRIEGEIQDSYKREADTVKGLKDQLAEYANTLDKTTKAGQANRDILSQMASGWNNLSDKQQNAKGAYKQAREDLIDQAKKFGATDKLAKHFADTLLEIPSRVQTKITLDKQRAQAALDAYSAAFDGLDGKVAKTIIQLRMEQITGPGGKLDQATYGGSPQSQSGKGGKHGRVLTIPTQRLTASDLTRGGYAPSGPAPTLDENSLGRVIARHARQLYGDVHISGDPTVWRRQVEQDQRAASTGKLN